jgi:uncharacterized protein Veg
MTMYEVKRNIGNHIGQKVRIKYNLGRNKYEKYHATIKELYDYVFTVENEQGIKSFSYSDVMINTIRIDY